MKNLSIKIYVQPYVYLTIFNACVAATLCRRRRQPLNRAAFAPRARTSSEFVGCKLCFRKRCDRQCRRPYIIGPSCCARSRAEAYLATRALCARSGPGSGGGCESPQRAHSGDHRRPSNCGDRGGEDREKSRGTGQGTRREGGGTGEGRGRARLQSRPGLRPRPLQNFAQFYFST